MRKTIDRGLLASAYIAEPLHLRLLPDHLTAAWR